MDRFGLPHRGARKLMLAGAVAMALIAPSVQAQVEGAPGETKFAPQGTFYAELFNSEFVYIWPVLSFGVSF